MNAERLDVVRGRLVSISYELAGYLGGLLELNALPQCHRQTARRLLDEFEALKDERSAALNEPSPPYNHLPLHVGAGALCGLAAAIAATTEAS